MLNDKPFALDFPPGIQRDGTIFDSDQYVDGEWCRFRLRRPRKIGGFRQITDTLHGIPRRVHCFYYNNLIYIHVGTSVGIQQVVIDKEGTLISTTDRTPSNFVGGPEVGFTMDAIFDTTSNMVQLVAHWSPDIVNLADATQAIPAIGQIDGSAALLPFSDPSPTTGTWTQPSISGGIVCVQPYVFAFDNNGWVMWSAANLPLYLGVTGGASGAGSARVSAQKIVQGAPIRGGGAQAPAAIFWSMSEVITAVYNPSLNTFAFTTASQSSSIISSDCVVEYDGLYFWCGVDRFMVFNGTVTEVPNRQNLDWFFNNLTPGFESKVWAYKVPRYGEIWFCAPMFGNTECSHAVIFNLRENTWYDTKLPDGGRSAGYFAQGTRYPIMAEPTQQAAGYPLWMHEYGFDKITPTARTAVRSYFETPWFGALRDNPAGDQGLAFSQLEPDFIQDGDLSVTVISAANARAPEVEGSTAPIPLVANTPQEQLTSFTPTQPNRLIRLRIESDVVGGNYQAGKNIGHGRPAGPRRMS